MGNKTPRPVGPSGIEGVSDSVDVELKGRLVCVEVALSCDQNVVKCTVPIGTKFILNTENNDWESTASTKLITVYMTCSFTDDTNKVDSDKIRHVLEEKFQSEGQLHINVYVIDTTENEAGKPLSSPKMITLDINVHGINVTHEEIYQTITTYLGPEYNLRLNMIEPTHDSNCTNLKGILITSQEVTLTSNGFDYVVPEGTGFILYLSDDDERQEKHCRVFATKEDVYLSHAYVEDVHIFTVTYSPFILLAELRPGPFLTVYLICYFTVTDISLFNIKKIATFLKQTYQSRSRQPIDFHVYEVESVTQKVSPSDSKLIGLNCQIVGLPQIHVNSVYRNMRYYFGDDYVVMPPH